MILILPPIINLYVVGELEGCIDLMHEDCECYCSSSNDAKIRIFDSSFQNLTFFTASRLYYKKPSSNN